MFKDFITYIKYLLKGDTVALFKLKELKALYKTFKQAKFKFLTKDKKITNLFLQKVNNLYTALNEIKPILENTLFNNDEKKRELYLHYFIESNLPPEIRNKKTNFTKDMMWNKILESENPNQALKEIEDDFIFYKNFITKSNLPKVEQEYYLLYKLNMLLSFNYEQFLSRFDINFLSTKKGENLANIKGEEILNELKDLYFLIASMPQKIDLTNAFTKLFRGEEQNKTIPKKLQSTVDKVYKIITDELPGQVLLTMCRYISEDPKLKIKIDYKETSILEKYKKEIEERFLKNKEAVLEKYSERSLQNDIKELFGEIELLQINGITGELNNLMRQNNIEPISGLHALRITKTFILKIYEESIRELINNLIVDGFFVEKEFQTEFSNDFFSVNELKEYLLGIEENLANSPKVSFTYLLHLLRTMNSKTASTNISKISYLIEEINERIKKVNEKCSLLLYKLGVNLYKVILDYKQQKPKYISNIKTIKGNQNKEFISMLVIAYNNIAKYIKIMKNFIKVEIKTSE